MTGPEQIGTDSEPGGIDGREFTLTSKLNYFTL